MEEKTVNLVVSGHVDHGKSTLIGRLLYDTDSLPPQMRENMKKRRGIIEFAFFMDNLEEERKGRITIDTIQTAFRSPRYSYNIIDTPGHKEFLKNMVTGASNADALMLMVSARKGEGVQEQTRRHLFLARFLGIEHVIIAVNKMDTVGYSRERFAELTKDMEKVVSSNGYEMGKVKFVPVSASRGENITKLSDKMPWYQGKPLVQVLDETVVPPERPVDKPLRIPVQDVYEMDGESIIVGKVETGVLRAGDELVFQPSGFSARLKEIKAFGREMSEAGPGESIGLVTEPFDPKAVLRGSVCGNRESPPRIASGFRGQVFLLGDKGIAEGESLRIRWGTSEAGALVQSIIQRIDSETGKELDKGALEPNEAGLVSVKLESPSSMEEFSDIPPLGRFVLLKGGKVCAAGTVSGLE